MRWISFALNACWTLLGLVASLLSLPYKVGFKRRPLALVVFVRSFWWSDWAKAYKGRRATTCGNVVLIGTTADDKDIEHELIHVKQYDAAPFIYPLLYIVETWKKGYRQNKYEVEAYSKSSSEYIE